jgi:ribosome-associated translation inhibitor RaiA
MQLPLDIRFHNTDRSPALETVIRERAEKLERYSGDIVSIRVSVEGPPRHSQHGGLYAVSVDLRFAGGEVVASRHPAARVEHEDIRLAVRDAFRAARRQLQDRVRKRDGRVKTHQSRESGRARS